MENVNGFNIFFFNFYQWVLAMKTSDLTQLALYYKNIAQKV